MKILLDHNIPVQLKQMLTEYEVYTARELRWDDLENGDLLAAAQRESFAVMITGDQSIFYQQNNRSRAVSLVVLTRTKLFLLMSQHHLIREAIRRTTIGSFEVVRIRDDERITQR